MVKAQKIKAKPSKNKNSKARSRAAISRRKTNSNNEPQAAKASKLWGSEIEHLMRTRYASIESAIQDLATRVVAKFYPAGKAAAVAQGYLQELLLNDPQLVERLRKNLNIA